MFYLGSGVNTSYFQGLIIEYLDLRKVCMAVFPAFKKVTMKMHNLEHYCFQLLDCGPFTCVWTARSESRHRDFVNYAESAKNFINLLKMLCEKTKKKWLPGHSAVFSQLLRWNFMVSPQHTRVALTCSQTVQQAWRYIG